MGKTVSPNFSPKNDVHTVSSEEMHSYEGFQTPNLKTHHLDSSIVFLHLEI